MSDCGGRSLPGLRRGSKVGPIGGSRRRCVRAICGDGKVLECLERFRTGVSRCVNCKDHPFSKYEYEYDLCYIIRAPHTFSTVACLLAMNPNRICVRYMDLIVRQSLGFSCHGDTMGIV